jgi:hypothetical protein
MADFFVRIDDLADYAAAFAKLTTDSESASSTLLDGFSQYADAWGDDAPGQAFFASYGEPATDALECAVQVPDQLSALSTAMTHTAQDYLGTEAVNTDLGGGATTA